ncbi:MAG: LuxR C-terminal-related transcriptional regulator [Sulfuritalea sp.]|nr:LuxR C-terminal-related transcriptional regulator [Sulfuritalea sp.]MCF8184975.1 LuxR C-terminal-related transcriptional regulator [Polynucleobacter sp.]
MYLTAAESRALSRLFGLLAEDMAEREVRERVGYGLLDLLRADHFASYVWDESTRTFGNRVSLNMSEDTLGTYESYYQFHDPITFQLQQRRLPTLVTQVMPQQELMRCEFFNDFLARDGLHWGVNAYSYVGERNIGDLRIWRGRNRDNFDAHSLELLRLIEPAFTGALQRASRLLLPAGNLNTLEIGSLSPRELEVARMVSDGLTDKEIAQRLAVELSTVRTYLKRSFIKLGVHRRGGVAAVIGRSRRH